MTRDEALKIVSEYETRGGRTIEKTTLSWYEAYLMAKSKLEGFAAGETRGYEQGVRDSLQVVVDEPDLTVDNLAYLRSHLMNLLKPSEEKKA